MREKTNPPYVDPKLNLHFLMYAADLGKGIFEDPAITNIAVVGGLFDQKKNLYPGDIETIERTIKVFKQAGVTMSPLLNFHFYNLLAPIKSDFMRAAILDDTNPRADAIILCGLCGSRSERSTPLYLSPAQLDIPYASFRETYSDLSIGYRMNREVSISHIQLRPDGWPMAANASGAKIVVTRGGDYDEISTKDFTHGGFYKTAIDTKEDFEHITCTISGSLGIMVHEKAVPELKADAKPHNLLGKRILAM